MKKAFCYMLIILELDIIGRSLPGVNELETTWNELLSC